MTQQQIQQSEATNGTDDDQPTEYYETRPTIKPPVIWAGITVLIGGVLALATLLNVFGLEDQGVATALSLGIMAITGLLVARHFVTIFLLTRTTYTVTQTELRHEFSLWLQTKSREIPMDQVRGHEFEQNAIQRAFGVGSISVLTGGTNSSLGYVTFKDVPHPREVNDQIRMYRDSPSD